jgi:molybdopterin-containing oxidoreductase family iron-sulfur binding subunit
VQPLIDPLYGGKSAHDVFQALLNEPVLSAYEAVRETWKPVIKGDFETGWRKVLHQDGSTTRHSIRPRRPARA